jgi:uncharacterized membrane protein YhfC
VLHFRRQTRAPWAVFFYGAIVYAVFQLFTWLPLSVYLDAALGPYLSTDFLAFVWLLTSAALTSIFEESGRWLGYRYLFPRSQTTLRWRNGVMYGLGHSSVETLLLIAGLTFITMLAYLVLGQLDLEVVVESLGAESNPALREALRSIVDTSWTQPLVVALERVLMLPHQVAWSLLVMESLVQRKKRWFTFALAYHTSIAVMVPGLARGFGFLLAESVNLVLAAFSLWIVFRLRSLRMQD